MSKRIGLVRRTGSEDLTKLLADWKTGSATAGARVGELVQGALRRIAAASLRRERPNHTLQPTELVNEAYARLLKGRRAEISDRIHFFAVSAQIMRRILVDHARRRRADKRAGFAAAVPQVSDLPNVEGLELADLLSLDAAMRELAALDERQVRILELRYFGGLSIDEVASALNISPATVKRELVTGRLWLRNRLAARLPEGAAKKRHADDE